MSLITEFDPWKNELCTCPAKFSLSPYTGCSHGCLYCYAWSYIRDFSNPRPKKDFTKKLERQIKKIPAGSIIPIANSSDPYLHLEKKLKLTRKMLEILKNYDLILNLVTKSDLILRDLDLLKQFKKIIVSISVTTLDEKLAKKLEPQAPSPSQRLNAASKLAKHMPVIIRLDPLIYPLTTEKLEDTIKAIKQTSAIQVITSTYKARGDNLKRMTGVFKENELFWKKLYLERGEKKSGYWYLPKVLRKELIANVSEITLRENLKFSSCREGFDNLNTAACDGTDLFK